MVFLWALFGIIGSVTILWIISIFLKNVSIIDIFWGLGFVVVNGIYFYSSEDSYTRPVLLLFLVTIWGLRLSLYLAFRNIGKGEDFRYREFRKYYGEQRYWWFSFFQVFLLQGLLITIVSLPLLGVNMSTKYNGLVWLDYIAIVVWVIGFIFETFGDFQLAKFKSDPGNKGKVLDQGLWKYTRHPNYFGDALVWWSYALFSMASGSYWTILGSVIMTFLIVKVSGVSLLEKSLNNTKPQYRDYIARTSSFFPWIPKK